MSQFEHQWQRLTALARQAPADRDVTVPAGFATRVISLANAAPLPNPWSVFERFALRGFLAATVCGVAAVAFSFSGLMPDGSDDVPVETLTFNPAVDVS